MEPIIVSTKTVRCDGKDSDNNTTHEGKSSPAIGHPVVYIHFNEKNVVHCQYCNRSFVFKEDLG